MFKFSKPTPEQLKRDAFLVVVAFVSSFFVTWQVQPDPFSKSAVIAAGAAGFAAVVTVAKSFLTDL